MGWGNDPEVELPQAPKAKEAPGFWESLATGSIQGASLGFADELAGAYEKLFGSKGVQLGSAAGLSDDDTPEVRAAKEKLIAQNRAAPTAYEATRDSLRKGAKEAQDAHPWAYGIGQAAGGMAIPIPGGAVSGATAGARLLKAIGTGTGIGTVAGIGNSEADTFGGVMKDAAVSGGFGALGGLVAGGIGEGARLLNGRAQRGVQTAKADNLAKEADKAKDVFMSKQGSERSLVQQASRDLEVLAREAAELPKGHPLQVAAEAKLKSPEGMRLREMVLQGKLNSVDGRIAEHGAAVAERQAAAAAMQPSAVQAASEASLANPLKTQVLPRVKTYVNRSIGPAIGGMVGGVPGAMLGTTVSNVIGRPGTAMANMVRSPSTRNALWSLVEGATRSAPAQGAVARTLQTPVRSVGSRIADTVFPTARLRALAEGLRDHPEDEEVAGY